MSFNIGETGFLNIEEKKAVIPTYRTPDPVDFPIFCENRNHQRTSGRVYPNKVVNTVYRDEKIDKEYTVVVLENDYIKLEILPEIGGRIYSALDKLTGYDFFYKQHVIKPALIGVLGLWISGGVEFNWPFHHRASGYMPCDYYIERNGSEVICWLSEHDPLDRMKGMVGIVLEKGKKYFETRVRLYNRTQSRKSFLWWENAAVAVNENYQIFFPQDVRYVNFHYLKSRTTFPVSGGTVYNGIDMPEERDISWHKNTRKATSYFAGSSSFDFFGGYDHGKKCGVVHIGDHHVSPGKKMFTWAYSELSKVWENALTDTDGQYAELMAGSYSDNQPNFSWIDPYETKQFSEYWYPISETGIISYANLNLAVAVSRENGSGTVKLTPTKEYRNVSIKISEKDNIISSENADLIPGEVLEIQIENMPDYVTVEVSEGGSMIANYEEKNYDGITVPPTVPDTPSTQDLKTPDELYLAGIHVKQYRDPAVMPDAYFKAALERDPNHLNSLIGMAEYLLESADPVSAKQYAEKAVDVATTFNDRPESGRAYFILARVYESLGRYSEAYDLYYKASFAADCTSKAMTRIAAIDIRNGDFPSAVNHCENALDYNRNNSTAKAFEIIALNEIGEREKASSIIDSALKADPLDQFIRYLSGTEDFYELLKSNPEQTCLDIAYDLASAGRYEDAASILTDLGEHRTECLRKPALYAIGFFSSKSGKDPSIWYEKAADSILGPTFFFRCEEAEVLRNAIEITNGNDAKYQLGCLLYNYRQYEKAAELWGECGEDLFAQRNLAAALFSHLSDEKTAKTIMLSALEKAKNEKQLTREFALFDAMHLFEESDADPESIIDIILKNGFTLDNIATILAKAYNDSEQPDKALEVLYRQNYVACEGGEHAIADQFIIAHYQKGYSEYRKGNYEVALDYFRKGQDIPISLGAGVWNHCRLIPLKYSEALCLEKLGKISEAKSIFEYIAGTKEEYFSLMYLRELPFYRASSLKHLGRRSEMTASLSENLRKWRHGLNGRNDGFFTVTPFLYSFIKNQDKVRRAHYLWLISLAEYTLGDAEKAISDLEESIDCYGNNFYAKYFKKYGFCE